MKNKIKILFEKKKNFTNINDEQRRKKNLLETISTRINRSGWYQLFVCRMSSMELSFARVIANSFDS